MGGGQPPPRPRWFPQAGPDPCPTQGGFLPPIPRHGEAGWALERVPRARLCFLRQGEPGAPGCSPSTRDGSLTPLQGRPSLASPPAPGEQPGAHGKAESPLATPQLLRLPVKGCSSPSSPQGLLPSLLATVSLPAWLNMKHKPGWVIASGSRACQPHAKEETHSLFAPLPAPGIPPHLC